VDSSGIAQNGIAGIEVWEEARPRVPKRD